MKCSSGLFQKGNFFHIYNRVVDGELLFRENVDYEIFLEKFKIAKTKIPVSVIAYCLMPNHFHFFLRQDSDIKIFKIFNSILSSYIQIYNRKYKRKGRLMGNKLQSVLVDKECYFLKLCKYIHFNPVKAKLVSNPENWEYSNYHDWLREASSFMFNRNIIDELGVDLNYYTQTVNECNTHVKDEKYVKLLFDNDRL
jgi:putative transposase